MLSSFATNLVGAFVALIVFQATNSLAIAFGYLTLKYVIVIIFTKVLKKFFPTKPQLFLLLRIITITCYNFCILMLDYNMWLAVILIGIFTAFDSTFSALPKEIIFNYSSLDKGSSSIGLTRVMDKVGSICAVLIGGFLLDINKTVVIFISLGLYFVSVVPLVMYYINYRKQKTFNKDATSNAILEYQKNKTKSETGQKISKRILRGYGIMYFCFAFLDVIPTFFKFYIFINFGSLYSTIGIYTALDTCFSAIGSFLYSKINEKKDTTILVVCSTVVVATCVTLLPFVRNVYVLAVIYSLFGFSCPCLSIFVLQRFLLKSRILGCSNTALYVRNQSCNLSYVCMFAFGITGLILPVFIMVAIMELFSGYYVRLNEEKSRKLLVDFLQDNETKSY